MVRHACKDANQWIYQSQITLFCTNATSCPKIQINSVKRSEKFGAEHLVEFGVVPKLAFHFLEL